MSSKVPRKNNAEQLIIKNKLFFSFKILLLKYSLKKKINTIRKENDTNLKSSDNFLKQLSSALYLIDALA